MAARRRKKAVRRARAPKKPSRSLKSVSYSLSIILALLIFIFPILYFLHYVTINTANIGSTISLELLFPSAVFSYLLYKGNAISKIIEQLGLTRDKLTAKNIGVGLLILGAVFLMSLLMGLFSVATNIPLPTNVSQVLGGMPLYFLAFSFLVAPICEEILFRGFLVPRIGIVVSAAIFAIVHLSYLSVAEFAAAFVFAILAGYVFKKTKSLYPSILAHMLVNFTTVTALLYTGALLIHIL